MLPLLLAAACAEEVPRGLAGAADSQPPAAADSAPPADSGPPGGESADSADTEGRDTEPAGGRDSRDSAPPEDTAPPDLRGNVLLVIADDMGLDADPCSGEGEIPATAPHIAALCERGVFFSAAWAAPNCSPARANMLTGTTPFKHGVTGRVGDIIPPLPEDAVTLPQLLGAGGVAPASFGKWHLGDDPGGGDRVPNVFGWWHFAGILAGQLTDYYGWEEVTNGLRSQVSTYATTEHVDDAITWIDLQEQPWVVWLAFTAPHEPFHVPPATLQSQNLGTPGDCPEGQQLACHRAAIQAMDTELGRLLTHLDDGRLDQTHVIFLGDNGSPGEAAAAPTSGQRAKGTLYEGGMRVPLVIAGPRVAGGRVVEHFVDAVDLFPTILELMEIPAPEVDGVSLLPHLEGDRDEPLRSHAWTLFQTPEGGPSRQGRAIRDARWKLIAFDDDRVELYDLAADPWETFDYRPFASASPEAFTALNELSDRLEAITAPP